jgi:hypothetical protein
MMLGFASLYYNYYSYPLTLSNLDRLAWVWSIVVNSIVKIFLVTLRLGGFLRLTYVG